MVGVLVIELGFVFSYVGGLGHPYPHGLPIAIVGPASEQKLVIDKIHAAGGQFDPIPSPSVAAAVAAIHDHKVDAAFVIGADNDHVIVAQAPSPAVSTAVLATVRQLEAQVHRTFTVTTIVPLTRNDPEGLAPFYVVIGWVVGGYLVASLMALARGTEPSLRWVLVRLGALAAFSVLSGILGSVLVGPAMHLIPGDIWALALIGTLVVFATSTVTTAFQIVFGELGIALAIVVFVVAGNPSAGGPYPRELLNGVWRAIGPYLPNGAGLDAVRNIGYFGSADLASSIWVLLVYSAVGVGAVLAGTWWRVERERRHPGSGEPTPLGATA